MSKRFLIVALFTLVFGLAGAARSDEAAKTPAPSGGECPHMKAMREAQEQGKGGECPHMKDGKPCDCPHHQAMKDGKEGGGCPHMKDGKPCDCPNHKAASAPNGDKAGKQAAKANKTASKKAKASSEAEAKGAKQ